MKDIFVDKIVKIGIGIAFAIILVACVACKPDKKDKSVSKKDALIQVKIIQIVEAHDQGEGWGAVRVKRHAVYEIVSTNERFIGLMVLGNEGETFNVDMKKVRRVTE